MVQELLLRLLARLEGAPLIPAIVEVPVFTALVGPSIALSKLAMIHVGPSSAQANSYVRYGSAAAIEVDFGF